MDAHLAQTLALLEAQLIENPKTPTLREGFQDFFDAAFARNAAEPNASAAEAVTEGLWLLRRFYNVQLPKADDLQFCVSLSDLCENLAFACDLLGSTNEKRIFYSGEEEICTACRPRAVLWAALNLISNAVFHTSGKYIFLHTAQSAHHVYLTVSAEGHFPLPQFNKHILRSDGGLHYAAQTARLHGGTLFLMEEGGCHSVVLSLIKAQTAAPLWAESDFTDWLADRLSPVYAAFARRGEFALKP